MKPIILLTLFLTLTFYGFTQPTSGGPDNFGYTFKTSQDPNGPSFQWLDITQRGTFISGLGDDNVIGPFPFSNFPFYNSNPNQLFIGSNGYLSFTSVNISSSGGTFPAIPTAGGPNNFIAPFLCDLTLGGASSNPGRVYYFNQGDTICVSFEKVPFWKNNADQFSGKNTFQVIFNKADSSITFNYKLQNGQPDPTYVNDFLSIGIENSTGTDGLQFFRGNTFLPDSFSVKYYYPSVVQPNTDLKVSWVMNKENAGMFALNQKSIFPEFNIENSGNQLISNAVVANYQLINSNGLIVSNGTQTVPSLSIGEDTTIKFLNGFTFNGLGRYTLKAFVSKLNNDNLQLNDTLEYLIKVVDSTLVPLTLDYSQSNPNAGSISWVGGNAGVGIYLEPPYYPARVKAANFFITNFGATISGFHSVLYDDNARGGGPGTMLDSIFVNSSSIQIFQYNKVNFTNNIIINDGGVYLLWLMGNGTIQLGRSQDSPASRQTFEVLGGTWSTYRDAETQDFLMNIEIEPISVSTKEQFKIDEVLNVYPNPSNNKVTVQLEKENIGINEVQVFNLNGQRVSCKILRYSNRIEILKGNLNNGQYFVKIGDATASFQFTD